MIAQNLIKSLLFCLVLVGLCFKFVITQAQDSTLPQPQLVMDGIRPTDLGWSDQQPILAFSDASLPSGSVINEFDTWYQFNIDDNTLSHDNIWPLQPDIPTQIEDQVLPGTLLFRSPTGRYYVFVASNSVPKSLFETELKVYDTLQNIVMSTGISGGELLEQSVF